MKRSFGLSRFSFEDFCGRTLGRVRVATSRDGARQLDHDAHAQERVAHALAELGLLERALRERREAALELAGRALEVAALHEQQGELVERLDARQRILALLGHAPPGEARVVERAQRLPRRARPQPRVLAPRGADGSVGGHAEVGLERLAPALLAPARVPDLEPRAGAELAALAVLRGPRELRQPRLLLARRSPDPPGP